MAIFNSYVYQRVNGELHDHDDSLINCLDHPIFFSADWEQSPQLTNSCFPKGLKPPTSCACQFMFILYITVQISEVL